MAGRAAGRRRGREPGWTRTDDGDALYRRRKQIVEPVFGHIKYVRGIDRLARRGLRACQAEWQLIAASHNLLKLYRAPTTA